MWQRRSVSGAAGGLGCALGGSGRLVERVSRKAKGKAWVVAVGRIQLGYPFVGDEDDAVNPAIALQPDVASTFMPQRSSAEPQVSSKPGIGPQIVAMGNREMPMS